MKKRKICVVTGTRAEYGILYWLMKGIQSDPDLELQIVVTGMHLSHEFGLTYREIIKDGFHIDKKVEMLLSSDTPSAISKSVGLGLVGFSDVLAELQPDILALLGDRFEILAASIAATFARIPIAHFHGGEATEGIIDEPIRHSVTKMSHLHFVAAKEYQKRVIQLGENPKQVFLVGGLGIDNIKNLKLYDKNELQRQLQFQFGFKNLLVTFHPVTLENATADEQFYNLLEALDAFTDINIIFTKPNADTEGRSIISLIDKYVQKNLHRSASFISLGQLRYLSTLQFIDGVLGNSSSGLVEAPTFRIGTINIGDRQRGRLRAESVIDCNPTKESIISAIKKLYSPDFKQKLPFVKNPYGEGGASNKIIKIIKTFDLNKILKKKFYNITFTF